MITTAQIQDMTAEEKVQAMEILWADLTAADGVAISAPWHEGALQVAESGISAGDECFVDWEVAKKKLRTMFE